MLFFSSTVVLAHDHGRPELNEWFKGLRAHSGVSCCDGSDATSLEDVDWDTKDDHYRVRLNGQWVDVPDEAVIDDPNKAGPTMVWPYYGPNGVIIIRCFLRGSMT